MVFAKLGHFCTTHSKAYCGNLSTLSPALDNASNQGFSTTFFAQAKLLMYKH